VSRGERALLFLVGLGVRLPLLLEYPGVYGDDSVTRLAYSDQLVLAYQLPLPQLLVATMRHLAPDPFWTRLAFALIGSLVGVLLAEVVGRLESPTAARIAGVLVAVHPLLVYYSMVPYQESMMLALLLGGAAALLDGRSRLASLCIGLACLCRYEAWIAAAIAGLRRPSRRAALLFGWAPVAWIVLWRGLSPQGTYVLDVDVAAGHLHRIPFLLGKLRDYGGTLPLVAAAAGAAWLVHRGDPRWRWGALYCGLLAVVLFLFGHEHPAGSGRVSERLIHVPAVAACAAAAVALARVAARQATLWIAVAVLVAASAIDDGRRVRVILDDAHRAPDLRLAMAVAHVAEKELGTRASLAVAAPAVPGPALEAYIRKVGQAGGDTARARLMAERFSRLTPDGVRIAAHLGRPAGTVIPFGKPSALVAVFDDAGIPPPSGPVVARIEAPPRGVTVYRGALARPPLTAAPSAISLP
jgi:hypothetical protein